MRTLGPGRVRAPAHSPHPPPPTHVQGSEAPCRLGTARWARPAPRPSSYRRRCRGARCRCLPHPRTAPPSPSLVSLSAAALVQHPPLVLACVAALVQQLQLLMLAARARAAASRAFGLSVAACAPPARRPPRGTASSAKWARSSQQRRARGKQQQLLHQSSDASEDEGEGAAPERRPTATPATAARGGRARGRVAQRAPRQRRRWLLGRGVGASPASLHAFPSACHAHLGACPHPPPAVTSLPTPPLPL